MAAIDPEFLEKLVVDMATMTEEPPDHPGGATGAWAERHDVDLQGLIRFLERWVADHAKNDHGAVTQGCYWFQAGYEARRKQQELSEGGGVKWVIERRYPDLEHRRPHDQPERWEGTSLREFGDRLEYAGGLSRENVSEVAGDLLGELVGGDGAANWSDESNDDGRLVTATLEWEV